MHYDIPENLEPKYRGAGYAIAATLGKKLIDFHYIDDFIPEFDPSLDWNVALAIEDSRMAPVVREMQSLGELHIGMCSGGKFLQL